MKPIFFGEVEAEDNPDETSAKEQLLRETGMWIINKRVGRIDYSCTLADLLVILGITLALVILVGISIPTLS